MLIGAYLDESFDPKREGSYTGTYVVGGVLGRGVPIFELERRWEKLRLRPDIDINYFKASECALAIGEFEKFITSPKTPTPAEGEKLESINLEFLDLITNVCTLRWPAVSMCSRSRDRTGGLL